MEVHTPPQEHPENELALAVDDAIARVFARQQAHRQTLRYTTAKQRIAKLKRLHAALFAQRQAIRDALFADFRKAPEEVDLTELAPTVMELNHAIRHLRRWMKPKKVRTPLTLFGTSSEIRYEPKGVGLIIAPWNYPFNLTVGPLVGAIAAGCPVMIKPSEYAPATARLVKTLLAELFDEHEVAVFEGDHRVAQALLQRPFNHIFFTGSPAVGRIVMRAAAEHLTSVTLELGGKSPVIIDETADVADAAAKVAFGKFANTGQTCIAPDYVYVHERVHDAFVEALRGQIHAFYGADAETRAATADYARIISERHHGRLQALYEEAVAQGARIAAGGSGTPEDRHIDPTVLTEVPPESRIMDEEIFGPVLPVLPYREIDTVLEAINSKPRPLALYLFSRDKAATEHILQHTTAGGTSINDTLLHFMHPELPFGGIGTSGIGQSHGHYGFLAFSNERPVLRQLLTKRAPLRRFYPPYTKTTQKLIDVLLKLF